MTHPLAALLTAAALGMAGAAAWAEALVAVNGEAEVRVAPDEVVLTLGVQTLNKDLAEARKANDQKMKAAMAAAQAAGVAARDLQTDYLSIEPLYDIGPSSRREFLGYQQQATLVVTLRDVAQYDRLLTTMLQAGVEYVHDVEFRTSQLRKHRDAARALAMRAAREKAVALAGELGQKVGKPRSIQEGHGGWSSSYRSWWARGRYGSNMVQNISQAAGDRGAGMEGALAPGVLSVRASVSVSFELE